jgi:beta-lactamase class A
VNEQTVEAAAGELIAGFAGEVAFLARNLSTGAEIGYQPGMVMPTASTIKLLVLAELFRQVDTGAIDLNQAIPIHPDDRHGGSGILKDLSPALMLPILDHAILMVALSDNTATAVLVRLLGREHILESAREWGMMDTTATFLGGETARDYAASTPRDIVQLLTLIATDRFISPAACAQMRDILVTQQYHDQIGRYLPYNQYRRTGNAHPGPVIVRSKSGFMAGVRVDAGIVEGPKGMRYVICLMTEGSPDRSFRTEQPGGVLNGRLSRLIFDAWWPAGVAMPVD